MTLPDDQRGMHGTPLSDRAARNVFASAVLDALPRAIIVTSPEGRILMWNRQAEELYGWRAEEALGRVVSDVLVSLSDSDRAREIMDVVRAGKIWEGDFTVLRRDGDPVRVWVTDRPILDESVPRG